MMPIIRYANDGAVTCGLQYSHFAFLIPDVSELNLDCVIRHLQEEFVVEALSSKRGDCVLVPLLVEGQYVELQDDTLLETVYLYASTNEANSLVERMAQSLVGKHEKTRCS